MQPGLTGLLFCLGSPDISSRSVLTAVLCPAESDWSQKSENIVLRINPSGFRHTILDVTFNFLQYKYY